MTVLRTAVGTRPLVCVETVALAHGVRAENRAAVLAQARGAVEAAGCSLAWLAMDEGVIDPTISDSRLLTLLERDDFTKIASRDLGVAHALRQSGGLTVSATLAVTHRIGGAVAATGAIGGVHRAAADGFDVSADLADLGRTPVVLVSAGIKPIVDAEATLEVLESCGVPVIGLGHRQAAFLYGNDSSAALPLQLQHVREVAGAYAAHRALGLTAGMLLSTRVPESAALPYVQVKQWVRQAEKAAHAAGVGGAGQTPFLVREMRKRGDPQLTAANEAALLNNIAVAAALSAAIHASR